MPALHEITMKVPEVPGVELRPIPGVIGYAAGSDGNVYSFRRQHWHIKKLPRYQTTPVRLFGSLDEAGRPCIEISWRGIRNRKVCSMVCAAFHGPRPRGMPCSHLNGDPADNRPENLTWEKPSDNNRRKVDHGTWQGGENNPAAVLGDEDVATIRRLRRSGVTLGELSQLFGVSETAISNAAKGKTWRHLEV